MPIPVWSACPVNDLSGDTAGEQFSLFGDSPDRMAHGPAVDITPDPARVRQRLHAVLETARAAPATPWPQAKREVWQIVFPNMAKWLPDDEAQQLCFAFAQELQRLHMAA
jgi:hypothetical protein